MQALVMQPERSGTTRVDDVPDALEAFVGLRAPLDRFAEAFDYAGVKATLVPPGA